MRTAERRGLIKPIRDTANRRLFTERDIAIVREHLVKLRGRKA